MVFGFGGSSSSKDARQTKFNLEEIKIRGAGRTLHRWAKI
jgi:hypothetical protein